MSDVWDEARWTPGRWAAAINRILTADGFPDERISDRTPSAWIRYADRRPRSGVVRAAAARALTDRIGRTISEGDLWPTASSPGNPDRDALDIQSLPISELLHELAQRRSWPVTSGLSLTATALDAIRTDPVQHALASAAPRQQLAVLQHMTSHLRELDDRHGGSPMAVRLVKEQLGVPVALLQDNSLRYTSPERQALLEGAAALAQLYGWLSFDAGNPAVAQHAFFRGMRAATEAGAQDAMINMLGMLAYICAHSGQEREAVQLAEHASLLARGRPHLVRSRVAGRLSTAYAAAGDELRHRRAAEEARTLLERGQNASNPSHLYYYSSAQLDAEIGQALVVLADKTSARRRLHAEATTALGPLASSGHNVTHQRSATLHGAYLALAHLARGELEEATIATITAARRLESVDSGRCHALLRQLHTAFERHSRNDWANTAVSALAEAGLRT
ncbi:hypothetical protein AB0L13_46180 [Saccharopolyspora shandongensis]|uniref:hypothetical protein n=1 Tax=Saccharopolyspora shandongensis TaxID=418495 RepID=UPI00342B2BAA